MAHTPMLVSESMTKNKTVIMSQPSYSADLAPDDFFLFPKLKAPMKGKRFTAFEEIKEKSKQELLTMPKGAFQKCFRDWKKRWHKRIIFGGRGGYLEGDKIVIDKKNK